MKVQSLSCGKGTCCLSPCVYCEQYKMDFLISLLKTRQFIYLSCSPLPIPYKPQTGSKYCICQLPRYSTCSSHLWQKSSGSIEQFCLNSLSPLPAVHMPRLIPLRPTGRLWDHSVWELEKTGSWHAYIVWVKSSEGGLHAHRERFTFPLHKVYTVWQRAAGVAVG